jgi:hypothetical protein
MRSHFLSVLDRAAISEIGGDPGCTAGVTADFRRDAGRCRPSADHPHASGWFMALSDKALPLCPRALRNSQPLRSSVIPAASM